MSATNDGGSAFPNAESAESVNFPGHRDVYATPGMTLRQYYAGRILSGFCANSAIFAPNSQCGWALANASDSDVAGYAVKLADELIQAEVAFAARSQGQGTP